MRKTITLPDSIEDAVREYQMIQMRTRKRDVPFTESLVSLVSLGIAAFELMADSHSQAKISPEMKEQLLNRWVAVNRSEEARLNGLQDMTYETMGKWVEKFFEQAQRTFPQK